MAKPNKKKKLPAKSYPSPWSYAHRPGTVRGVLVGPMRYIDAKTGEMGYSLDILDLDRGVDKPVERIGLHFFGHGFSFHPRAPHEAAIFEKRGPGGCYVDLLEQKVLRRINPLPDHHFYGHGSFSIEGDVVFAIESSLVNGEGAISVRDAKTFDVLEQFPTYGMGPHDCALIERGTVLAITNAGSPVGRQPLPCVTFVEVKSRKLLDKHDVTNPNINTGHIALTADRDFAVVSAPRDGLPQDTALGGLSLRTGKKPMQHVASPAEAVNGMIGETLSVAIHGPTGTVAATSPRGGVISFWSLYAKTLRKAVTLPNVRGVTVTLDDKLFVVGHGDDGKLSFFDPTTLEETPLPPPKAFGGSHLYTWAYPAA